MKMIKMKMKLIFIKKKTGLNRNTFYPGADIFNENNISFDIIKNDCSNNNKFNEMDLGKKSGFPN